MTEEAPFPQDNMEIELKLLLDPIHAQSLQNLSLLQKYAQASARVQHLKDIYYDTPALEILRSHAGLRVRQLEDTWVQTLKGGGSAQDGLHSRHEWETTVPSAQPDLAALRLLIDRHSPWEQLLAQIDSANTLQAVFSTNIRRTLWDLQLPQGSMLEFVLDEGRISCGANETAVCEVEIELKSGAPEHLLQFARSLSTTLPLQPSNTSKAERGYTLFKMQR